ncbi:pentapeptide repeat-containing protein [Leucobacter sp. NPDC015123]|uniref:pentapeptide repeat-containing protein n=1 Tax=Leucobacter sp. NPDC015123 TaxID=3364129 RepID=UPI0036F4636E
MVKRQVKHTPRVEPLVLAHLAPGIAADLTAGADVDGRRIEVDTVTNSLAGMTLMESEVVGLSGDRVDLRGARFIDSRLTQWAVPVLSAPGSTWRDAELQESRVGALDMSDAEVRRVTISGAKVGWINLRGSVVHDVVFRDCTFDEVDLGGAKISRVAFVDCVTEKLSLTQAHGEALDLRGLEFHALEGFEGLRGAVMTSEQVAFMADAFASHFGVVVEG